MRRGMSIDVWFIVLCSCLFLSTLSFGKTTSTEALRRLARRVGCYQDVLKRTFVLERNLDRDARNKEYKSELMRCRRDFLLLKRQPRFSSFIWPGTKWCGPGDIANNYTDLGTEREADKCCRAHDHCPDTIHAFTYSTKYRLFNANVYTLSSCACDSALYQCLQNVNRPASNGIGETFFNKLSVHCFKEKTPGSSEMAFFPPGKYVTRTTPSSISPNTTVSPNTNSVP